MDMTPTIRRWAWFTAATLAFAAAWYALFANGISMAPPPEPIAGASQEHNTAEFLAWFRDGLWQDIAILTAATVGFLALAGLGQALARRQRDEAPPGSVGWDTAGRLLVVAGILGAVAQMLQLGGHQAVAVASSVLLRLESVTLLHFTIDEIHRGMEVGVYGLMGAGLLAAMVAGHRHGAGLAWTVVGAVTGVVLVALAAARLTSDPLDIADPLLLVAAFVGLPGWVAGLAGALDAQDAVPSGHAAAVATR